MKINEWFLFSMIISNCYFFFVLYNFSVTKVRIMEFAYKSKNKMRIEEDKYAIFNANDDLDIGLFLML